MNEVAWNLVVELEKLRKEQRETPWEPIPLYIHVDVPQAPSKLPNNLEQDFNDNPGYVIIEL